MCVFCQHWKIRIPRLFAVLTGCPVSQQLFISISSLSTAMVAGPVASAVRETERQAGTAAVWAYWGTLPQSACLLTNFSTTSREGGEMSKNPSASVRAANINGANDLTWGKANSFLQLFADGTKEYPSHCSLILPRDSFPFNCSHIEIYRLTAACWNINTGVLQRL